MTDRHTDPIDLDACIRDGVNPDGTREHAPLLRAAMTGRRPVIGAMLALLAAPAVPSSSVAADAPEPPVRLSPHLARPIVLAPVEPPPVVVGGAVGDPAEYADAPTIRQILDECQIDVDTVPDVIGYVAERLIAWLGNGETTWPMLRMLNDADAALVAFLRRVQAGERFEDGQLMLAVDDASSAYEGAVYDAISAGAAMGFALGLTQPDTIAGQADWTARALAVCEWPRLAERPERITASELVERDDAGPRAA